MPDVPEEKFNCVCVFEWDAADPHDSEKAKWTRRCSLHEMQVEHLTKPLEERIILLQGEVEALRKA